MLKKFLSLLLIVMIVACSTSTNVFAQSYGENDKKTRNELSDTPPAPIIDNPLLRGENPPSSSATVHDLSKSAYDYKITKVGAQVYTNKWITGKTSFKVTVSWMTLVEQWYPNTNPSAQTTVTIYDNNKKAVASKLMTEQDVHTFTGLSASAKYYVEFSVTHDGNFWSFWGTIE